MENTVLYAASAVPLEDTELYAAAYSIVTPERRAKTDRFRFEKDRRLSLSAEILLRYAFEMAGEPFPERFDTGSAGKPLCTESKLRFNLSHSHDVALCAVSEFEVGCDIEKISDADMRIARRYFFSSEYEYIASADDAEEQKRRFFRLWTLKESFMKVTGLGMSLPLDAFSVSFGKNGEVSVSQSVDSRSYRFAEFSDIPSYACAVCTASDSGGALLQITDIGKIITDMAGKIKK